MKIVELPGTTRVLGEEQGYRPLPVIDIKSNSGTPSMVSGWSLNQIELTALQNGAVILVQVIGTDHPPMLLTVSEAM